MIRNSMVVLFAVALTATAQQPKPDDVQKLYDLTDQIRAALGNGDFETALRLNQDLSAGLIRQTAPVRATPQQQYQKLKQGLPAEPLRRYLALPRLAMAALNAGDLTAAEGYARESLADITTFGKLSPGDPVFYGNLVIGRIALERDKDIALAKTSLLAAGKTVGSPALDTFGPNMTLAKALIEAGERQTVLEFFGLCRSFWKTPNGKLDEWTGVVQSGGVPNFGANLLYGN